ncbi:hypothetical protein BDU57DRAFT_443057 [Ampelomyces quisqualis]|uniref:Uncharacterized protein n=1 Tax=Ampelomyces quisqualis TaxID=50730 RepID=A0A6A5QU45_AMPQU|nr:hypothetical protein BDU57DRAFT_443057 [Ampelomyces quisqualis]
MPETPYLAQIPFRPETPEDEQAQCYSSFIDLDIYDSERSNSAYQTPIMSSARAWQSGFAAIPEESSRHEDSPPISPKSASPPKFDLFDRAAYNLPVYATTIPEETPDTIDPFLLSKDTFALRNNTIKGTENGLISLPNSSRSSLALAVPQTQKLADLAYEPLVQAAFPFGSPTRHGHESPVLGHVQSEVSSVYSLPSPLPSLSPTSSPIELPSPVMPCSPRPSHARLPMSAPSVAIDFSDMPRLAPSPQEPRRSAPRPLRTSIAALRRMNSDVADARKEKTGRGERRYLRLGREYSTPLPGDESWLDDIEDDQSTQMSDLEGISLAADALDEWDEGQTILDLNEGSTLDSISTITPDTESYAPLSGTEEQEDTMAGAEEPESRIWDDGEKFWNSQTPPRPLSPTKPRDDFQYRVSSPLASPALSISTADTVKLSKKRDFEVAKDSSPLPPSPTANREKGRGRKKRRESADEDAVSGASSSRYRKRSVLGVGTPNVRIQVTSPSGRIVTGTPGSLYDSQGFLRY